MIAVLLLMACGALMAAQATVNTTLGRSLGGLPFFAFVFSVVQLVCTVPVLVFMGWPPRWDALTTTPAWQHVGGLLGVPILIGMAFGLGRTGTFAGLVALLVGQLAMGLAVDQFGLLGAAQSPVTWNRLAGLALVLGGVVLSNR